MELEENEPCTGPESRAVNREISYPAFLRIFRLVMEVCGFSFKPIKEERSTMSIFIPGCTLFRLLANLSSLHEKCKASRSETLCFMYLLRLLRQLRNEVGGLSCKLRKGPPGSNFFVAVGSLSSLSHTDAQCFSIDFEDNLNEAPSPLFVRRLSKHSRDLMIAPVIGQAREASMSDMWIRKSVLSIWNISEDGALALSIHNTSRITKQSFIYYTSEYSGLAERARSLEAQEEAGHDAKCLVNAMQEPLLFTARFADRRALSRVALPRFVSLISEALRCPVGNIVVIPFADTLIYAADCESIASMCILWSFVHEEEKITTAASPRPYRVSWP